MVFEEGMVGFSLIKKIALVFDRQPPGNDHNPPPTSHGKFRKIIDSKMLAGMGYVNSQGGQ